MRHNIESLLAFTWYARNDYERLLEVAEDAGQLFDDYDEWLVDARRAIIKYRRQGFEPKRVLIRIDDLLDWCDSRGRPVDHTSREMYKEIRRQQFYRAVDNGVDPDEFE